MKAVLDNLVFDTDSSIIIAVDFNPEKEEKAVKKNFGYDFLKKPCLEALKYPRHNFPDYSALFQRLNNNGRKIFF